MLLEQLLGWNYSCLPVSTVGWAARSRLPRRTRPENRKRLRVPERYHWHIIIVMHCACSGTASFYFRASPGSFTRTGNLLMWVYISGWRRLIKIKIKSRLIKSHRITYMKKSVPFISYSFVHTLALSVIPNMPATSWEQLSTIYKYFFWFQLCSLLRQRSFSNCFRLLGSNLLTWVTWLTRTEIVSSSFGCQSDTSSHESFLTICVFSHSVLQVAPVKFRLHATRLFCDLNFIVSP